MTALLGVVALLVLGALGWVAHRLDAALVADARRRMTEHGDR